MGKYSLAALFTLALACGIGLKHEPVRASGSA